MDYLHLSVIPAKAGIHWLQVLRDPCLRRDDGKLVFFDTREGGNPWASILEESEMEQVFTTKITDMLGIDHPILCGGMQWISRA
jgi:hypothetical protein